MVQHAFSMVLYGMTGYTFMSAIVVGFWSIRAIRFRQAEVRANIWSRLFEDGSTILI